MELDELQEHWDRFGRDDPLWAVITDPSKRYGKWDSEEFMMSGVVEVQRNLDYLQEKGVHFSRQRALDFGCGPGRATQALCGHFAQVDGVDLAPSMIDLARSWNRFDDRCRYHVNDRSDLSAFTDRYFDFIYTFHVLQHMVPQLQLGYLKEFTRCLSDDGVALAEIITDFKRGASGPLPASAFRADIRLDIADRLVAGLEQPVTVHVRNASPLPWPAAGTNGWYGVTVGNRWRDVDGTVLVGDDARALFARDVQPGDEVELVLTVRPPNRPGRLILEVDAVQEGVAWFQDRGSSPDRRPVELLAAVEPVIPGDSPPDEGPRMEMHVLPLAACRAAVRRAGGRVVDVAPLRAIHGGEEYDYERSCVTIRRMSVPRRGAPADRLRDWSEQAKDYVDLAARAAFPLAEKARRKAVRAGRRARGLLRSARSHGG